MVSVLGALSASINLLKRKEGLRVVARLEQGVGEIELRASFPLYGHRTLPDGIADRLNEAMRRALKDTETAARLAASYIEPLVYSRTETAEALQREHGRLASIIRQLGIKADGS